MARTKFSFHVTRAGWALLALGLFLAFGAFYAALNLIYLLASLVLAIFVVSLFLPVFNLLGLACRRVIRRDAFAGEPFDVDLWLQSKRRTGAYAISVEEPLQADTGRKADAARRFALHIAPQGRVQLSCTLPPRARGVYPLPRLRWSSAFPFGMARCSLRSAAEGELLVFPARGRLGEAITSGLAPRTIRAGAPSRTGLQTDEFRSIREYRPGDNVRRIHWRASARLGTLCVREVERERAAPVVVLLDSRIPASTPESERPGAAYALEMAVSFAAEACRMALELGNSAYLVGFFPEPRLVTAEAADGAVRTVYEALARLEPSEEETAEDLREVVASQSFGTVERLVAVTPTLETASSVRACLGRYLGDLHIAADPGFTNVFRLLHSGAEVRP